MFRIIQRRNVQKRIVVVMALLCLVICAVNVQFCLERQVVVNIVARTTAGANRLNQQENYFDMSLNRLMDVAVVS